MQTINFYPKNIKEPLSLEASIYIYECASVCACVIAFNLVKIVKYL